MSQAEDSPNRPADPALSVFYKEDELQELIANRPYLVPGIGQRSVAVAREVRVPPKIGRADVVLVSADGAITVVECKLAANAGSHSAVVGQMIAYAAGLTGLAYEDFKTRFEALGASLTAPFEGSDDWDEAAFRVAVVRTLASGSFRLVVAVDHVPSSLGHTIAYLNARAIPGLAFETLEVSNGSKQLQGEPGRKSLAGAIRGQSGQSAAEVAEKLLGWAEGEPRLSLKYHRTDCVVSTPGHTLFRIVSHRDLRVSIDKIAAQLNQWDTDSEKEILRRLAAVGILRDGKKARAPLDSLDADSVVPVLKQLLEDLNA